MNNSGCRAPISRADLLAYWLGEFDETTQTQCEEHLLGCAGCAAELQRLVDLGVAVCRLVGRGVVSAIVSSALPQRLADNGVRLREYRVPHNGSVCCTVAPDDDVVIARLASALSGIERVDVLFDLAERGQQRLEDVPFDPQAGEIVVVQDIGRLRALPPTTLRMQLIAVEHGSDRMLGEYTFHHTPWK